MAAGRRKPSVLIVGAGFGGIGAAIELLGHGFDDVTVLEAGPEVGGTWHDNTYPGAACDVPSHLYSYSFAQRAAWSRFCSPQPEILDYLQHVAEKYDVTRHVVTDTRVRSCVYDESTHLWLVTSEDTTDETGSGETTTRTAEALIVATGQLHQPAYPRIEGLDTFAGTTFHSAHWSHDYDLRGKRIAVIGSGASAVQFVPAIVDQVASLTVFQRTGNWFLPRRNHAYPRAVTALFRGVPATRRLFRWLLTVYLEVLTAAIRHPRTLGRVFALWARAFMRGQLKNPQVRRAAWPNYAFGCKRVLFSSAFLPALQRPNAELVTEPIAAITPVGPRTADGRVHEVDAIIFGTGFRTHDFMFPMEIVGRDQQSLRDSWAPGPFAHLGMTVPGFPSMFVMYGPNTNTSGGSIIFFLEAQAAYIRKCLDIVIEDDLAAIEVRDGVAREQDRRVQSRFAGTAWTSCTSWYVDESGRNVTNWPGYMREYAAATHTPDPADFILHPHRTGN